MATIPQHLEQAIAYHRSGQHQAADGFCRMVLEKQPQNRDALWLLGAFHQERGQLQSALEHFEAGLMVAPRDLELLIKRAECLGGLQRLGDALKTLKKATKWHKKSVNAFYLMGNIHFQQGDFKSAITAYRKVDKLKPNLAKNLGNMGSALSQIGQLDAAIDCYERVMQCDPQNAAARHNLAQLLVNAGRLEAAKNHLLIALQHKKISPLALNLLGQIHLQLGETERAIPFLRAALQGNPQLVDAYTNLGTAHRIMGKEKAPIQFYQKALSLDPNHLPTLLKMGAHLLGTHEAEQAKRYYAQALTVAPENEDARSGMALIHSQAGEVDKALALIQDLVTQGKIGPNLAVRAAKIYSQLGQSKRAISILERSLKGHPSTLEQGLLNHALGDVNDKAGDYEAAFMAYKTANALRHLSFDAEAFQDQIHQIKSTFTAERFTQGSRAQNGSERPIFIVGMPRSGTSLTEQILDSHPQVFGAGELEAIVGISRSLGQAFDHPEPYPHYLADIDASLLEMAAQKYIDHIHGLNGESLRVTDKMPQNFMHLGLIALLFPKAKIIHIQRNALDTCLSCYVQNFKPSYAFTTQEQWLVDYYRGYRTLMDHWRAVLPLPIYELSYEALVDAPEETIASLLDFCDLPFDEACLSPHQNRRVVKTASSEQVKKPIQRAKISRSQAYAPYATTLVEGLKPYTCS